MNAIHAVRQPTAKAVRVGDCVWLLGLCALNCLTGCGDTPPASANPERAKAALQAALDAWQEGETRESLLAATPPIYVSDSEWHGGSKLIDYRLVAERTAGFGWRCDVQLTVQGKDGRTRKHPATYRVDTDPALVVVHEE